MTYIREYTPLNPQFKKQLHYKRLFKRLYPEWDDTLVLATNIFKQQIGNRKIRVLDFGCGNGNWIIDELKGNIKHAVGVDRDLEATRRNTSVNEVIKGHDLSGTYFKHKEFDGVLMLWTMEHLEEPELIFKQVQGVLKQNGYFVIVCPNKNSFLSLFRILINMVNSTFGDTLVSRLYGRNIDEIFPVYYRANTLTDLKKLADSSGFMTVFLKENFDPSYTSFNGVTFFLSRIMYLVHLSLFRPHIVAVFQKKQ